MQNRSLAIVFGRSYTLQCAGILYRENFTISHIPNTAANKFTFEPFSPSILLPHEHKRKKKKSQTNNYNNRRYVCFYSLSSSQTNTHTHISFIFFFFFIVRIFVCVNHSMALIRQTPAIYYLQYLSRNAYTIW